MFNVKKIVIMLNFTHERVNFNVKWNLHGILSEKTRCYNVYINCAALCSCCIINVESYLQIDKNFITRELSCCKTLTTNSGNALKQALELLPIPLQAVHYEFSSEMLDSKLEMNMLKMKTEKLHLNQMHNKSSPNGATIGFEL